MKRKVRVYKPMAQQGMQQQAPDPQLIVGTMAQALKDSMDQKGDVDLSLIDQYTITLTTPIENGGQFGYTQEDANAIIQQALSMVAMPNNTTTPAAEPQPFTIDPNVNPFSEQEAMNQQILDEAMAESPVDLVARKGLQMYQTEGEKMGDFYDTYETRPVGTEPIVTYDALQDLPPEVYTNQAHLNMINTMTQDPFLTQDQLDNLGAMGALPTQNLNPQKSRGATKKQYAKNVMNYMKQAGGIQEAEMVDNTDDMMNTRQNTLANFFSTLANQSKAGVLAAKADEFAENTYDQYNDYMQRGGQRRAMRQANRAMRRAGRAMRGMPMMPGFMGMPMTPFGPADPFISQFLPVNATASTNTNPYGIESIEHRGRGLFRRPSTTVNFFNPYDYMDRAVVDAETVGTVTETPVDGNNKSMDGKVQSQAKTNTEVKQVETHSQKKDNSKSGKKEAAKAEAKAEQLDQSNTATTQDPRAAAMQEWKDAQAQRKAEGRNMSTGLFDPYNMYPNQNMWNDAMGELSGQDPNNPFGIPGLFDGDLVEEASIEEATPEEEAAFNSFAAFNKSSVTPNPFDENYLYQKYPFMLWDKTAPKKATTPKATTPKATTPKATTPKASVDPRKVAAFNEFKRQAMSNVSPFQLGGFVNPDLYKYIYGAQKKKAIDFELPEAQGGYMMGSGYGLPPVYDGRNPYNPAWRYDKRTQAPNFAGSLLFGAAGAGLSNPFEYAGSWIKNKGTKGTYTGQPVTSIQEKQDIKGRGKKWKITAGTDAPKGKIDKSKQMTQFMDPNAPMTDEQYIEMMQGDKPGRRKAADFFYKLGQRSGLNDGDNLFTKIGTKLEPWEEIPEDVQQSMQNETLKTKAVTPVTSSAPTADEMSVMRGMDPTPGMDPLVNAINIQAPDANKYIVSDPSRGQINPAFNQTASSTYSNIPEEDMLQNPDLQVYTPNMDVSNLSGQEFSMSNTNPNYPFTAGDMTSIQEPFYPGFGPYALEDTGYYPSMVDVAGIQQSQDYDRQSAYEDYVRRSMGAQDMSQRGVYGQDLIDQEFANKDDWFTVGIPEIRANQARRAGQRADIAAGSSGRRPVRGEGVGNLGTTSSTYGTPMSYEEWASSQKAPIDYAVEAAMTDYSSIPDEEFFTDYAPTIQALTSEYKMESNEVLKEALRRDLLNLHREINSRSASLGRTNRTNEDFRQEHLRSMDPKGLADFFSKKKSGGALGKYQGSMNSQVAATQQGSAYPGNLLSPPSGPLMTEMADPTQFGDDRYFFDGRLNTLPATTIDSSAPTVDQMQPLGMTETVASPGGKFEQKLKRKDMYNVDFPMMLNWANTAGHGVAQAIEDSTRNWENFSSDEITQADRAQKKGFNHVNTGLSAEDRYGSGLQFQAKKGGTYKEGQVTYLSQDQIREIMENGGEIEFV